MKKRVAKRNANPRYARLNPSAIALTSGIFSAVFILLAIIAVKYTAVPDQVGFSNFSLGKILVSIVYSFIDGIILGVIFAWLYNRLNEKIR